MKINLGSGTIPIEGFVNIDHRNNGDNIMDDAFELTSFKDNSVSEILASHILEHACFDRTQSILTRWKDILIDGGTLWIAVPNFDLVLNQHIHDYCNGSITWEYFNSRIFGNAKVARKMYGDEKTKDIDGVYQYELAFHRSVFTPIMLVKCLEDIGFSNVKLIEQIPYKKKHPHEICCKGIK